MKIAGISPSIAQRHEKISPADNMATIEKVRSKNYQLSY
jgi:hypothetical protein